MDITIHHKFTMSHQLKANTLQKIEYLKRRKYNCYLRQHLVFAPTVAKPLKKCEPDLLETSYLL